MGFIFEEGRLTVPDIAQGTPCDTGTPDLQTMSVLPCAPHHGRWKAKAVAANPSILYSPGTPLPQEQLQR